MFSGVFRAVNMYPVPREGLFRESYLAVDSNLKGVACAVQLLAVGGDVFKRYLNAV